MFAHGYILLIAGQSEEAETLWREILAEVQNGAIGIQAICLINLADALNQQARFSEALPLLMTAVQMVPERGVFYRELVNYYQFQHVNAERAFDLSECMIRFSQRSRIGFGLSRYSWTATLAVRALAFANVQRYEEAAAVLGQIFRQADRQFIPGMAFLSCQAAEIEFLKGNHMAAIANFDKAIALDAKGRAGNLARKRMADLAGTDHPT